MGEFDGAWGVAGVLIGVAFVIGVFVWACVGANRDLARRDQEKREQEKRQ